MLTKRNEVTSGDDMKQRQICFHLNPDICDGEVNRESKDAGLLCDKTIGRHTSLAATFGRVMAPQVGERRRLRISRYLADFSIS